MVQEDVGEEGGSDPRRASGISQELTSLDDVVTVCKFFLLKLLTA